MSPALDGNELKLIFLTGHRKSGTTLLHKLFDGHPQACVYPVDVSLFYGYFPAFPANRELDRAQLLERICLVVHHSLRLAQDCEAPVDRNAFVNHFSNRLEKSDLRSKSEILEALVKSWQSFSGADPNAPVVIKETSQAAFLRQFLADFPNLKMINLLRDPRDNYAALKAGITEYYSKLGESDRETLASLINRSRLDFISARINGEISPDAFMNIRFETLVSEPENTMTQLAEFAGMAFHENMLTPTLLGYPFSGNSHEGLSFTGISSDNAGRWTDRIASEEAKVIEYWMRDEMEWAGYDPIYAIEESQEAYAKFYEWYNTRYFFRDAFDNRQVLR